jgi:transcriptional regulator with XRE-family HTH domain
MRTPPAGSLAHFLQRARITLGLTQGQLAKKVGLRRGYTVSRWEGGLQAPTAGVRNNLLAILGGAPAPHGSNLVRALGAKGATGAGAFGNAALATELAAMVNRHADAIDASPKRVRAAFRDLFDLAERHGAPIHELRAALGEEATKEA